MIWRCHGIPSFHFFFCSQTIVREINWMGTTSVANMVIFCRRCHYKITWSQLYSKFFLNIYEAPWQRHLRDTLQMKILRTWSNIGVEPYYCMPLFLSNKLSFKIKPSVDRIIFALVYLPFYLSIFCVSWRSSSTSTLFS